MKSRYNILMKLFFISIFCLISTFTGVAQEEETTESKFLDNVSIGGGLGLSVGNGIFSASISPTAVYNFNKYFSAGPGLQYSYQSGRNFNTSLYGASLVGLANPIPQVQISAEIEQLRYNINGESVVQFNDGSFGTVDTNANGWNTALFIGAGYRAGPATIGLRYNVLYKDTDDIYATAFVPFVRVFF